MDSTVQIAGVWTHAQANSFMRKMIIPLRLSALTEKGSPLVLSLWFLAAEEALWCATNQNAFVVKNLTRDGRCGFELAGDTPPYRGVRGQGHASLHPERGASILERLLARYSIDPDSRLAQTLMAKADQEVAIRIAPEWITSWDFRERMRGAIPSAP